ncbi:hypothetical protein MVEN_01851000 [Mycena venus]|uniref:F-box domain-containing protein n=1 Tax=Mycena venus TaxID=2733690 RepID=A0A8H6XHI6_9AGAR|nr:hypothetical protein MVEN_01851000 [Mycena venus]
MWTWRRFSSLSSFLRALPNLVGLQIYHGISWDTLPILSYAFAEVSLPTVTALSVPVTLDGILPAFPNVKTLACPALHPSSRLLTAATKHFPCLDALAGLRSRDLDHSQVNDMIRDFPHLRALSVSSTLPLDPPDLLARLRAFKQLTELELVYQDDPKLLSLDALVSGGRDVLLASRSTDAKVLRLWSHDTSLGPRIVRIERF